MKSNWIHLFIIVGCCLAGCVWLTACSPYEPPAEEVVNPLQLSVNNEITTDRMEVEFDILSGNGGYRVNQTDSTEAHVSITGTHVQVVLLKQETYFSIIDSKNKGEVVHITSTSPALLPAEYTLSFAQKGTSTLKPTFGNGKYTVKPQNESTERTATAEVKGNEIEVNALRSGIAEFVISDSDGRTAPLTVEVAIGGVVTIELQAGDRKEIEVQPDRMVDILLQGGSRWKVEDYDMNGLSYLSLRMSESRVRCVTTTQQDANSISSSLRFVDQNGGVASLTLTIPGTE